MHSFSSSWLEVLEIVAAFSKQSRVVWYRGQNNNSSHSDNGYKLKSGLFRLPFTLAEILEWEYLSYMKFMENGFDLHKTENEWDLLYIMQQFGLKTRLLDWSESFAVALFFAIKNWNKEHPSSIWMLDPYRLNELFHNTAELIRIPRSAEYLRKRQSFIRSLALSPYVNTTRGLSQKGYFTLQGNTHSGLEEEEERLLLKKGALKQIQLSSELTADIELFLTLSGVNHFTLFPDLSGLATYINHWATAEIIKKYDRNT